jgi:hypothetical protein
MHEARRDGRAAAAVRLSQAEEARDEASAAHINKSDTRADDQERRRAVL